MNTKKLFTKTVLSSLAILGTTLSFSTPTQTSVGSGSFSAFSATFVSPADNYVTTSKNISVTMKVEPTGAKIAGQDVKVYLIAKSDDNTDPSLNVIVSEVKTIKLSSTTTQNVTFSNVSLAYPENYLHCYYVKVNPNISGDASEDADVCGATFAPYNQLHVTYKNTQAQSTTPLFRFWSDEKLGHFFTTSIGERDHILQNDKSWRFEGVSYSVGKLTSSKTCVDKTQTRVFRFWNPTVMHHFYTANEAEKNVLVEKSTEWKYEDVAFCANMTQKPNTSAVYRFYSEEKKAHFFTANEAEKKAIIENDKSWRYENIAYYAMK